MAHRASVGERAHILLAEQLGARRDEIERAVLTRIQTISDPTEVADPEYADGLRAAVSVAVAYGLAAVELGEERSPSPPPILLAQARLAARNGVGLDTVLRRYFAGHALVGDYLVEGAGQVGVKGAPLQGLLRNQAALFDRLVVAISEEYAREKDERRSTGEERHAELIGRLLAGELIDASELAYDFDGWHFGAVASGPGAENALSDLAASLNRRLMLVRCGHDAAWAWLGSRRRTDPGELERSARRAWPSPIALGIGEQLEGLDGWRLTHRQARAASLVARRGSEPFVRYANVILLATVLQDDLAVTSLQAIYLAPLEAERDGGEAARQTLRAYFDARGNVSSAAAALGLSRQAVNSRLRAIEELIGHSLDDCAMELEAALRMGLVQET
jgi:hypothetical protein